ncbi:hypothetical protein [Actinoallomurus iriomotensis]|uniref:Uncharacterized protein n=1 Tax=Actinoallomurus iriomotensis TaxID=478107 RepID=A0A9W6W3R0_9ACTN|nr:hypothetical protein [Actinoallomurus iriomotensis]GLY76898.1 hypothetical protein Airi01_051650 [Actinoallomurus iriomotensis]GLY89152.1 hypothetical protein Airi02_070810 [Actinoallomurus iriomotensis]
MADRQVSRLKAALADRDARVRILEARVAALEESTSLRVGRAVTDAARSPGKGVVRLPRELYRMWRHRGAPNVVTSVDARERPMFSARDEDRLIVGSPATGLIVAGVLGAAAAEELGRTARVVPLMPHDAALIVDTADVDLVLVDAAAGAPGGPWAYLGVPGVPDRERALLGLMDVARGRGRPLVLLGSAPGLAGLGWDATLKAGTPLDEGLAALRTRFGLERP